MEKIVDSFYCGSCGKHKPVDVMEKRPGGRTKICKSCNERAKRIAGYTDRARDAQRLRNANALLHAARRNALSYHVPDCPRCGEGRYGMQLTYWLGAPAEWRCRKCGYAFLHEPVVSNA